MGINIIIICIRLCINYGKHLNGRKNTPLLSKSAKVELFSIRSLRILCLLQIVVRCLLYFYIFKVFCQCQVDNMIFKDDTYSVKNAQSDFVITVCLYLLFRLHSHYFNKVIKYSFF